MKCMCHVSHNFTNIHLKNIKKLLIVTVLSNYTTNTTFFMVILNLLIS